MNAHNPQAGADLDLSLRLFLEWLGNGPADDLAILLEWFCDQGHGHWQNPSAGGPIGRPATHLFEVSLLGVSATGTTAPEAAQNWRTCARRQTGAEA